MSKTIDLSLAEKMIRLNMISPNNDFEAGFCKGLQVSINELNSLPTTEKTGCWVDDDLYADNHLFHVWRCSKCDKNMMVKDSSQEVGAPWFKYCPNCGARMDTTKGTKI